MVGNVYEAHEKKKKKFTTCSDHKATSLAPLFNSWTETHALKGRGRSDQQSGVGKMRNFFFTFPVESANRPWATPLAWAGPLLGLDRCCHRNLIPLGLARWGSFSDKTGHSSEGMTGVWVVAPKSPGGLYSFTKRQWTGTSAAHSYLWCLHYKGIKVKAIHVGKISE